ncbi:MAG TPA: hypothetical protein VH593_09315 [Ktedonobacteraceae bacterium]|jgi:hypothetical protein
MQQTLTAEETEQLTAYLRPLVDKDQREERSSVAYLWAVKHPITSMESTKQRMRC